MPDNSVDLICTDPPYYKVKSEWWDRQWDKPQAFLAWIGQLCDEWARVLKPNGSLYCFASPKMAARVEVAIGERFNVLNSIVWAKPERPYAEKYGPENFRQLVPQSERIVFAEHFGADNMAKGEAGYEAHCDELRGFVFEPLRAYLDGERLAANLTPKDSDRICGNQMAGHYFTRIQWALPTSANYAKLREATGRFQREYEDLRREYEDLRREYEDLRREYEDLRREYEDLRRPFSVTADVPYTDVWDFPTVQAYKGKHPCEKPLDLLAHIVRGSSRENAVVMDCFMGSGNTGRAARTLGRRFIGCDIDPHWVAEAERRILSTPTATGQDQPRPSARHHKPMRAGHRPPIAQPALF